MSRRAGRAPDSHSLAWLAGHGRRRLPFRIGAAGETVGFVERPIMEADASLPPLAGQNYRPADFGCAGVGGNSLGATAARRTKHAPTGVSTIRVGSGARRRVAASADTLART